MSNLAEQSSDLARAGMPPAQAEAVAKAIHDALATAHPEPETLKELRGDIGKLSDKMDETHKELRSDMKELRGEMNTLHGEVIDRINDLAVELAEAKGEFKGAKWILAGILLAVTSAAVKYIFFSPVVGG